MGSKSMFELERSIQNWKQTFHPGSSIGTESVQEVEAHLRDSIERLQNIGLSDREAFAVGAHRLGVTADLESEFAKNQPVAAWRSRLAWMFGGYIAISLCYLTAQALVAIAGTGMAYAGINTAYAAPTAVAVKLVAWASLVAIGYRALQNREHASNRFNWKWAVLVVVAICALLGVSALGSIAQISLASASWYGNSAVWLSSSELLIRIVGYVFCVVAMCKLTKPLDPIIEERIASAG